MLLDGKTAVIYGAIGGAVTRDGAADHRAAPARSFPLRPVPLLAEVADVAAKLASDRASMTGGANMD